MRVNMILHLRFVSHLYMALNKLRELGKECVVGSWDLERVKDCCLTPTQQFFSIYHGENMLIFNEMMIVHFVLDQHS